MKLSLRSVLFALPLVVVSALTGCAADSADEATSDSADMISASAPITIANYIGHPKVLAIRAEVLATNQATLTKSENPGCDGTNTKWTDASGTVRQLKSIGGEGGFEGSTEVWYGANGLPLFGFHKEVDHTGEKTGGSAKAAWVSEWRTYFGADGEPIFQAVREGAAVDTDAPLPQSLDRLPNDHERITAHSYADPIAWYSSTGCGSPDMEEPGKQ